MEPFLLTGAHLHCLIGIKNSMITRIIIYLIVVAALLVSLPLQGAADKGLCRLDPAGRITSLAGTWYFRYGDKKPEIF